MINIKKEIFLKPNSLNKDKKIEFCIWDCSINNKKCDVYTDTEYIKIKNKDIILTDLIIKNNLNTKLTNVKFKICNTDFFKFIPSSLRNTYTREVYTSENITCNIFYLGTLQPNEVLNLKFNMLFNLDSLNSSSNNSLKFLNELDAELKNMKLTIDQAVLRVVTRPKEDKIEIENIGSKELKNIVYNYEIPEGYIIDTKSIKYNLNGALCNIFFKTINNNIVFKFSNIPGNTYDNKKIIISLKHIDTNTLLGPSFMILN